MVGLGGLVGCLARHWIGGWVQRLFDTDFPLGTLTVNLLGSFVIGLVLVLALERSSLSPHARLLLATGFCGGFTTMSTFSYETLALFGDGQTASALGYIAGTLAGCLAATWLGQIAGRLL